MINVLVDRIKKLEAPIVVGLDPMLSYVPEFLQKEAIKEHGETLEAAAEAVWPCMSSLEFRGLQCFRELSATAGKKDLS